MDRERTPQTWEIPEGERINTASNLPSNEEQETVPL